MCVCVYECFNPFANLNQKCGEDVYLLPTISMAVHGTCFQDDTDGALMVRQPDFGLRQEAVKSHPPPPSPLSLPFQPSQPPPPPTSTHTHTHTHTHTPPSITSLLPKWTISTAAFLYTLLRAFGKSDYLPGFHLLDLPIPDAGLSPNLCFDHTLLLLAKLLLHSSSKCQHPRK